MMVGIGVRLYFFGLNMVKKRSLGEGVVVNDHLIIIKFSSGNLWDVNVDVLICS